MLRLAEGLMVMMSSQTLGITVDHRGFYCCSSATESEVWYALPRNWSAQNFGEQLKGFARQQNARVIAITTTVLQSHTFPDANGNRITPSTIDDVVGNRIKVIGAPQPLALARWHARTVDTALTELRLGVMIFADQPLSQSQIGYFVVINGELKVFEGNILATSAQGLQPDSVTNLALEFWRKVGRGSVNSLVIWSATDRRIETTHKDAIVSNIQMNGGCSTTILPKGALNRGAQLLAADYANN
ncbi:MAG TPA: hypothetical protein VFT87_01275 [Candidatus Saccharimonadales bacterium]|nr:hypothetical protein [Candidatus Saccharimonadales bacterium]